MYLFGLKPETRRAGRAAAQNLTRSSSLTSGGCFMSSSGSGEGNRSLPPVPFPVNGFQPVPMAIPRRNHVKLLAPSCCSIKHGGCCGYDAPAALAALTRSQEVCCSRDSEKRSAAASSQSGREWIWEKRSGGLGTALTRHEPVNKHCVANTYFKVLRDAALSYLSLYLSWRSGHARIEKEYAQTLHCDHDSCPSSLCQTRQQIVLP